MNEAQHQRTSAHITTEAERVISTVRQEGEQTRRALCELRDIVEDRTWTKRHQKAVQQERAVEQESPVL